MFKDAVKAWVQANGGDFVNQLQKEYGRTFTDAQRAEVLGAYSETVTAALRGAEAKIRAAAEGHDV